MVLKVHCCSCSHLYRLSEDKAGRKFRCKVCDAVVSVPTPDIEEWGDFGELEDEDESFEDDQPYRPPRSSSRNIERLRKGRHPKHDKIARSIRAICILYIVFGSICVLAGLAMLSMDALMGLVMIGGAGAGTVSGIGVLKRQSWGIPFCKFVSFIYLFNVPLGTILGGYFLLNIDKIRDEFS